MSRLVPNIELQGQASNPGGANEWVANQPIVTGVRRGVLTNALLLNKLAAAVAPETRASTTTLTNSTQLQATLNGAGTYAFRVVVYAYNTTAVTGGITANVNYSGNFTAAGSYYGGYAVFTGGLAAVQPAEVSTTVNNANTALTSTTLGIVAAAPSVYVLEGTLIATGAGVLAFAFAQSANDADTVNLAVGSYMTVNRLV